MPAHLGRWRTVRSGVRTGVALGAGATAALLGLLLSGRGLWVIIGWDVTAAVLLAWTWAAILPLDAAQTRVMAVLEDPSRPIFDALVLSAAVAAVTAVVITLFAVQAPNSPGQSVQVVVGLLSVLLSWALVHLLFCLTYARLYYLGTPGGVNFKQEEPPAYADFAYLAFTVGMTYQVSDSDLTAGAFRRAVLRHALISFGFGTIILAITVNIVAGLGGKH